VGVATPTCTQLLSRLARSPRASRRPPPAARSRAPALLPRSRNRGPDRSNHGRPVRKAAAGRRRRHRLIDYSHESDHPRNQPYSITGTIYEVEEHPGDLWLGREVLAQQGRLGSWITVAVLVPARQVTA